MSKSQYHTRLAKDTSERVDEYKEERDLTTSEAVRRLVVAGLEEIDEEEEDDDDKPEVATDGGAVARRALGQMATIYAVIAIIPSTLYTLRLAGAVDFAVFSMPQLHTASLTAFVLMCVCFGTLYTRLPERIDRAMYSATRTARKWAPEV